MLFAPSNYHYAFLVARSNKKPATKPGGTDAAWFSSLFQFSFIFSKIIFKK
jgi:hypothetical protein